MAEFCLECFNKYYTDVQYDEEDVNMSIDLCEHCGQWKPCIITIKEGHYKGFLK